MKPLFLGLYEKFLSMNGNGKDLDHMLSALPWKEVKREDGSIYYICDLTNTEKSLKGDDIDECYDESNGKC